MTLNDIKAQELKRDFPILKTKINGKQIVYLDNSATTQKPSKVIDKIENYYETTNANIHRGVYKLSEESTLQYEKAHEIVADLINADPKEIIFTKGTTDAINLLAYTLNSILQKNKKEIVLTEMEHHSNLIPWQQFAKRNNLELKFIKIKDDYTLDYEDAENKITDKTALVSMVHISNSLGTVNDIQKIIQIAKKHNAITIIDAAQSAPRIKIDVKSLDCDFLAFSGHKMCGPTGTGVLYGKKELLEKLDPFNFGGDMIKTVSYEDATWNELPWKFEAGTPNIAGGIALGETIKYIQKIGLDNIEQWEKELLKYALEKIKNLQGITLYNSGLKNSTGIISFNLEAIHAHDVASILGDEGICIRGGHHCTMPLMKKLGIQGTARASFYFYNTYEDVDKLIEGIKKVQNIFSSNRSNK